MFFLKYEGCFGLNEDNLLSSTQPMFKYLEQLGFITSCDATPSVMIRVNGYDIVNVPEDDLCLETFCIARKDHHNEWV